MGAAKFSACLLALCGSLACCGATPDSIRHAAELPERINELNYHTRVTPPRWRQAVHTLFWDYRSDSCHHRVEVEVPALADADIAAPSTVRYSVYERRHGQDSIIESGKFASEYGTGRSAGFSTVLKANTSGAVIEMGARKADKTVPVPFDMLGYGAVATIPPEGSEMTRHTLIYRPAVKAAYSSLGSIEDIARHIAASNNTAEGFWTYLDRNTDSRRARLGGRYSLATVLSDDGTYRIIYLGGASENPGAWREAQVKGALIPTPFKDHFDLRWTDAYGNDVSDEASATITVDGLVLELSFPLLGSSLRFRRASPALSTEASRSARP